jgi:hypothetical protein
MVGHDEQFNFITTCSGNGRCRGKDGTCICDYGWTGAHCSIPTCPGVNCHACKEDTYSGGCDKQCNFITTCSGNGRCRGKDGTCICDDGWTGAHCSIPTCPGVNCHASKEDTYSGGCDKQCNFISSFEDMIVLLRGFLV